MVGIIHGNALEHRRSMRERVPQSRRRCGHCGTGRTTHVGQVRGQGPKGAVDVALTEGCEWCVRQWVRDPRWRFAR